MYNDRAIEMPPRDFAQKLASALAHHPNSALTTINLSNNPLEDRGTAPCSGLLHSLCSPARPPMQCGFFQEIIDHT